MEEGKWSGVKLSVHDKLNPKGNLNGGRGAVEEKKAEVLAGEDERCYHPCGVAKNTQEHRAPRKLTR